MLLLQKKGHLFMSTCTCVEETPVHVHPIFFGNYACRFVQHLAHNPSKTHEDICLGRARTVCAREDEVEGEEWEWVAMIDDDASSRSQSLRGLDEQTTTRVLVKRALLERQNRGREGRVAPEQRPTSRCVPARADRLREACAIRYYYKSRLVRLHMISYI